MSNILLFLICLFVPILMLACLFLFGIIRHKKNLENTDLKSDDKDFGEGGLGDT